MKALFLVNGTGMGHITQTFALVELAARHGLALTPVAVMVTNCTAPPRRGWPSPTSTWSNIHRMSVTPGSTRNAKSCSGSPP